MKQSNIIDLIHPGLQKLIQDKGWKTGLSEIQKEAIPTILKGENCVIEAPTAGGKTEAVFFPCLTKAASVKTSSVQVLYIAPLRALLNNIEKRAIEYSETCGLKCFKWHGDVGQKEKIEALSTPPNVLLTTPESLEAILLRKPNWISFFKDLQSVIIDEAHNFAPVDRGCHLVTLMERLFFYLNVVPQRIAITATVGNPNEMLKWIAGTSTDTGKRIFVKSNTDKDKDFQIFYFSDTGTKIEEEVPASYRRLLFLYDLIKNQKTIIFGGSRSNCEAIATAINKLNSYQKRKIPVKVRTHHSSVSKYYREEAESKIQIRNDIESGIDSIISTSTLELGIDIGELDCVVQIDAISRSSAFLQRVGRTGRRPGKPQHFRGLFLEEDDLILVTAVLSLGLKGISEKLFFPQKSFHILAHQLICLCLQNYGIHPKQAWDILSRSFCFSLITKEQFNELVRHMLKNEFLRNVDGDLVTGEMSEKFYLSANYKNLFAVFTSGPLYEVYSEKKHVGNLDCGFVESMATPFFFVLGGIEWEAYNINPKSHQVFARKTAIGNAPKWTTFQGADVPIETAKEVGNIIFSEKTPINLSEEAKDCFQSYRMQLKYLNWSYGKWILAIDFPKIYLYTFAGDRINRTLAKLINIYKLGIATSNYKSIHVKLPESDLNLSVNSFLNLLSDLKLNSKENPGQFQKILEETISPIFFSKFDKCLPDKFKAITLAERSYDLKGLIEELSNNKTETLE